MFDGGGKGSNGRVRTASSYGRADARALARQRRSAGSSALAQVGTLCHDGRMAKTVIVKLTDDIDGGDADETVHFALDGRSYEIDVSTANADAASGAP